jgi:hypothetical protein
MKFVLMPLAMNEKCPQLRRAPHRQALDLAVTSETNPDIVERALEISTGHPAP